MQIDNISFPAQDQTSCWDRSGLVLCYSTILLPGSSVYYLSL